MAHLSRLYSRDFSKRRGLAAGDLLFEVQFPFSDPSADGKAIQTACAAVLSGGWRVDDGFAFVETLRSEFPGIPVFVMTYANLAYKIGISAFVERSFRSGVSGLIIPDLPFDADEGLAAACEAKGTSLRAGSGSSAGGIPHRIPRGTSPALRIRRPALRNHRSSTSIDDGTLAFLSSLKASESRILGGFGIRSGDQSGALSPAVHAVVAGSVFVDIIREKSGEGGEAVRLAVQAKAAELSNPVQR